MNDLYLIGKPPVSSDLEFQPHLPNPMVVVTPANHRLAKKNQYRCQESRLNSISIVSGLPVHGVRLRNYLQVLA